jgi:hypothetical protein
VVRPPIPEVTPIPDGARCAFTTRSTLPGVRLRFPPQPCSFDVDRVRRAELRWEIVVEAAPGELVHTSTRACPPSGAGGFIAEAVVRGGDQRYCLCDTGLCPPGRRVSAPGPGVYPGSLAWDGRAWEGPSDFGNPKGAPFPPGRHTLEVVARGTRDGAPWEVAGTLEITLTTAMPAPAPRPSPQPAPKPAPSDPPVKPDLSSPEATRCETSADCQISCAMSCCGAPCGCRTALNVATARAAEAWGTRDCPPERDCPEVACAYQPAMGAECVRGVCRAIDGLGGGW